MVYGENFVTALLNFLVFCSHEINGNIDLTRPILSIIDVS